jgi:hypothetical protein
VQGRNKRRKTGPELDERTDDPPSDGVEELVDLESEFFKEFFVQPLEEPTPNRHLLPSIHLPTTEFTFENVAGN